jgi:hypothetical protein
VVKLWKNVHRFSVLDGWSRTVSRNPACKAQKALRAKGMAIVETGERKNQVHVLAKHGRGMQN